MTPDLFQLIRDDMKDGFQGIHDRLDQINGRVRATEQDIAVLKDRGDRKAMLLGGGGGAVLLAIVEAVKAYLTR